MVTAPPALCPTTTDGVPSSSAIRSSACTLKPPPCSPAASDLP